MRSPEPGGALDVEPPAIDISAHPDGDAEVEGSGTGAADGGAPKRRRDAALTTSVPLSVKVAVALFIALGVAFRFMSRSDLWLDEALTVNIAGLPLSELPEALRHDGAPPLYYVLLHWWMRLFGDGDFAVRALSATFSVASLPLMWLAGRRLGGTRTAWAAVLLLASSPFAVRFASQTRMYSLVVLLVLLGFLALHRFLERPAVVPAFGLALVAGLLSLTHYWAFFLLAATVTMLLARLLWSRGRDLVPLFALCALAGGGALFVPWIRSFVFQMRYTGAPWQAPGRFTALFDTIIDYSGGNNEGARLLLVILLALAALGLFGHPAGNGRVEIDLRTRPKARGVAAVGALTMVFGLGAAQLLETAYAFRYSSVALVPFLLLVALGVRVLEDQRIRHAVLAAAVLLGLVGSWNGTRELRTQAGQVAHALERRGADGDVVLYCPDQLGPAVSRKLSSRFQQLTFPAGTPPQQVDWVQYEERQKASNPTRFAMDTDRLAGDEQAVWLVWAPGYSTYKNYCQILDRDLGDLRPTARVVVTARPSRFGETATLVRYPPTCRRPLGLRDQPIEGGVAPPCPPGAKRYIR